jgi:hypothetical protein
MDRGDAMAVFGWTANFAQPP